MYKSLGHEMIAYLFYFIEPDLSGLLNFVEVLCISMGFEHNDPLLELHMVT